MSGWTLCFPLLGSLVTGHRHRTSVGDVWNRSMMGRRPGGWRFGPLVWTSLRAVPRKQFACRLSVTRLEVLREFSGHMETSRACNILRANQVTTAAALIPCNLLGIPIPLPQRLMFWTGAC